MNDMHNLALSLDEFCEKCWEKSVGALRKMQNIEFFKVYTYIELSGTRKGL
mgnify:CR=1 FL=1